MGGRPLPWLLCGALGACALAAPFAQAAAAAPLEVVIASGRLRGAAVRGARVFRGIPYAAPPIGEARWRPPVPHPGWRGTLDATDFGPSCPQPRCWVSENVTRTSEDCLTINVVAPRGVGPYPVMAYIHAGEFHCGASNDAESNWPNFADDVVFVSMNYRVGVFGFLGAEELRPRHPRNGTGNYGLLDQRLALEWVRENIGAFGGDPSGVAIAGESSGGSSVAYHLVAGGGAGAAAGPPPFRRAILQSPGLTQVKSFADAVLNFEWTLAALTGKASPGCLRRPGYSPFQDVGLMIFPPSAALRMSFDDTLDFAKDWCDGRPDCAGFWRVAERSMTSYVATDRFIAQDLSSSRGGVSGSITYMKAGPQGAQQRLECLLSASATLLEEVTQLLPRDDTFQTDAWAPVVDGVDLLEPLTHSVAQGKVAQGVDLLLGTNLDEGTEFMGLTPRLACTAHTTELQAWATEFYGPAVGRAVPALYEGRLRGPLPACGAGGRPTDLPGEQAASYNAAMRSAGDAAIRCPTRQLAQKATGASFLYQFTMTPTYSVNFGNTSVLGAFHGAEVPFVFADEFELKTDIERSLSRVMGCYWRSFLWHGDPSAEACGGVAWPRYTGPGGPVLELGAEVAVRVEDATTGSRCGLFALARGAPVGLHEAVYV